MSEFRLRIEGDGAEGRAQELQQQLAALWPDSGRDFVVGRVADPGEGTRTDPVALAALIVSLPSAVLAAMDLAKRVDLVSKLRRLQDWAMGKGIKVTRPDGREEALADVDPGEWIDIALDFESPASAQPDRPNGGPQG